MKIKPVLATILTTATLVAVGCDQQEPAPAPAVGGGSASEASPGPVMAPPAVGELVDEAAATTQQAAGAVTEAATAAQEKADEAVATANEAKDAATEALTAQATKLYDDAKAAISSGDLTKAKGLVDQLSAMKDKLPPEWQTKVEELVKMVASANLPGMPK